MPTEKHNRTGYVCGCRCEVCKEANKEYQRQYMKQWRQKKSAAANEAQRTA